MSQDINKNRSIAEALAYEEQFFHDHPVFSLSQIIILASLMLYFCLDIECLLVLNAIHVEGV